MPTTVESTTSLNVARRARDLASLDDEAVDLLVIGGGVTGTGIALDAATRGLSVALVEQHDLAFGTSRWSSKLIHGGLRYLSAGRFGIAYESARERHLLLQRNAPHLVRPLPQIVPMTASLSTRQALLVRSGQWAGDLLRLAAGTSGSLLPRSRRLTARQLQSYAPTLATEGLRGGLAFWDGQLVDDARLVVALARTAAGYGARILTRCRATDITGTGAILEDRYRGQHRAVRARMVINATGVWSAENTTGIHLRPSRGTHLVFSQTAFGGLSAGVSVPVRGRLDRFVFALPAPGHRVYLGLTDVEQQGAIPDEPTATEEEIDFLFDTFNSVLQKPLRREQLLGTFSGLRPLLDSGEENSADVSREHAVVTAADGLVTVVGGKLTTYRHMAEQALDAALAARKLAAGPCRTRDLPLVGAAAPEQLARIDAPEHLVRRYGTEAPRVLAAARGDTTLLQPLAEHDETIGAEFRFAIEHEGALDEGDLLDRRTRVGLARSDRAQALPMARRLLQQGRAESKQTAS